MKKTEVSIREKTFYRIVTKIDKFAVVEENGKLGLIILYSGNFMVSLDNYVLDRDGDILIFTKKRDGEEDTVTIFDVKKRFHYGECKLVEKIKDGVVILRNKFDDKMHFFCSKPYDKYNIHNLEFDSYTRGEMDGKYWILFKLGNKKGLFIEGRGMVLPLEQDDIQVIGDKIVFTKDGNTRINVGSLWSEEYDSIRLDPNIEDIIYCQKGNETFVYYIWEHQNAMPIMVPILKTKGESIKLAYHNKLSDSYHGVYQFIIQENEHYNIREISINAIGNFKEGTLVTHSDRLYDAIYYENGIYFAYKSKLESSKAKKESQPCEILYPHRRVAEGYFRAVPIGSDEIAYFSESGKCHVRSRANVFDINAFEDARSIRSVDNGFIYSDGTSEILFVSDKNVDSFSESADEIQWLGGNYYLVNKNGVKRLHHHGIEILDQDVLNATVHCDNVSNSFNDAKHVWAILEFDRYHNRFQLASMTHHNNKPATNFKICKSYEWVSFYPDFILTLDEKIKLYSYDGTLLAVLPPLTTIDVVGHCGESAEDTTIYSIDGENYIIQDGEFINIPVKERPLHMAVYEGEYGSVVVNSNSQEDFSQKCAEIEGLSDENFETILQAQYNSSTELQKKYPSLVLKQIQKK